MKLFPAQLRLRFYALALTAVLALGACANQKPNAPATPVAPAKADPEATEKEKAALEAAVDAYVYGYPLVTMEMTRRRITNVEVPTGTRAPMGQFVRLRAYPDASFRDVTAPNADTLYTIVWLDVSKEPWVVSIPDLRGRYALFPMLDGWTDVFQVPGRRTTGTAAQRYAITGPGWSGTLPAGVTEYKSPTGMVWLLGRIYCSGAPEDYSAVHALQDRMSAVPLSAYDKPYEAEAGKVNPAWESKVSVRENVDGMDGAAYFKLLAELMKTNPPSAADAPMVVKLATIGFVPGKDFETATLDPVVAKSIAGAPKPAQERIMGWLKESVKAGDATSENGWVFSTKTGLYRTNYIQRAFVTAIGLGANRPEDTIYSTSESGADGNPYSGEYKYVMHFDKLPPVNAFWSITMYNTEYFFVANPLNRYNVSSRDKFKANKDGSIDVYIQNESPGKAKEANWLPAPKDKFILMLRMYWPRQTAPSILDGTWKIPPAKKVG